VLQRDLCQPVLLDERLEEARLLAVVDVPEGGAVEVGRRTAQRERNWRTVSNSRERRTSSASMPNSASAFSSCGVSLAENRMEACSMSS
jgi:hypothetical protein